MFQILGDGLPQMGMPKYRGREEEARGRGSIVQREETSIFLRKKGIGAQWYMGYAPEKYSIRGERIKDKVGGGNFCGVWGM